MIPSDLAPRILVGHVLEKLGTLPDESVQCVVTSPPYWGLRAYGTEPQIWGGEAGHAHEWADTVPRRSRTEEDVRNPDSEQATSRGSVYAAAGGSACACGAWKGELGNEPTPEAFVSHLADVFDEVRRVLRKDGTLWLNLGDSYNGSGKGPTGRNGIQKAERRQNFIDQKSRAPGLKPKDLVGIPWRVAFELQRRGWWLRSDCIWAKQNPMPESVRDRPTRSHEYVFLLTKSERYFYDPDAVRTSYPEATVRRLAQASFDKQTGGPKDYGSGSNRSARRALVNLKGRVMSPHIEESPSSFAPGGANLKSVWWFPTQSYPEAHFATYPETLPETCILAGTSERGMCPSCGTPWRRIVSVDYEVLREGAMKDQPKHAAKAEMGIVSERGYEIAVARRLPTTVGWAPTCKCYPDPCDRCGAAWTRHPGCECRRSVPCVVLDPFCGSGTTLWVARQLGRRAVGIELNPGYAALARRRCLATVPDIETFPSYAEARA